MSEELPVKKNKKTFLFEKLAENHFILINEDLRILHFKIDDSVGKIFLLKINEIPMLAMIPTNSALTINLIKN